MTDYTAGGKKYGQLKATQQNELESINQVRCIACFVVIKAV